MSWDFANPPWEAFVIIALIVGCLCLLAMLWIQGENLNKAQLANDALRRENWDLQKKLAVRRAPRGNVDRDAIIRNPISSR